ncbi:MAG TPA: hypothetical protein VND21_07960 [Planctomycetota bacterium]|nr:hypothetical protein [Planctomycetota bacterium]
MIRIGIDEAGYGPLLGPLVVAGAVFRVADDGTDLRERLRGVVCRARGKRPTEALPVAIDDSKEVHGRYGVEGLARGVAAMVVGSGRASPTDLVDWLERFGDRPPAAFAADPWFHEPARERVAAWDAPPGFCERLKLRGVEPRGITVSPATAAELNEAFEATGNKARVLFLATAALLVRLLAEHPGEDVTAVLDREGGRLDYGPLLAGVFPFQGLEEERAPPGEAWYRLREGGRTVRLRFVTKGDRVDLATGLASMAAKLTRELFMGRLNAWFADRRPGLRPTAGYVDDGRRFLADVADVLEKERVDHRRFVRQR